MALFGLRKRVLPKSPDALGYPGPPQDGHPAAIEAFKPGHADRTLGLRLQDKRRKDDAPTSGAA